jgi:ATP-dependent 26S proteasome regulatory subunit
MVITAIDDMVKYGSVLLQSRCPRDAASVYARELVDAMTKAGGKLEFSDGCAVFVDVDNEIVPLGGECNAVFEGAKIKLSLGFSNDIWNVNIQTPVGLAQKISGILDLAHPSVVRKDYNRLESVDRIAKHFVNDLEGIVLIDCVRIEARDNLVSSGVFRGKVKGRICSLSISKKCEDYVVEIAANCGSISDVAKLLNDFDDEIKLGDDLHPVEEKAWSDLPGYGSVRKLVDEYIVWPLCHEALFNQLGMAASKGILLHGPPGCGKTTIAKIVASQTKSLFYAFSGADITSKYYGESSKLLKDIFDKARGTVNRGDHVIMFFDDIDTVFPLNGFETHEATVRLQGQLLHEMDGLYNLKGVIMIAATNHLERLDPALIRPGRFGTMIMVNPPDDFGRFDVLKYYTGSIRVEEDVISSVVKRTSNYSGAMLEELTRQAKYSALRRAGNLEKVRAEDIFLNMQDFECALRCMRPPVEVKSVDFNAKGIGAVVVANVGGPQGLWVVSQQYVDHPKIT